MTHNRRYHAGRLGRLEEMAGSQNLACTPWEVKMTDIEKIMLYVAFVAGVMYLWERIRRNRTATPNVAASNPGNETPEQFYARWQREHGET
jgi:hypothetical protein